MASPSSSRRTATFAQPGYQPWSMSAAHGTAPLPPVSVQPDGKDTSSGGLGSSSSGLDTSDTANALFVVTVSPLRTRTPRRQSARTSVACAVASRCGP
ncbi:MAG: hypothetical protein ACTHQ3_09400 [Motilibacteraceae bacterium]